jgi:formylglycine-generating enzyme required for sulfatase activity
MAQPGGVYISGGVYEQIKNKLVCGYQSLGDEKLKNITDPVRIYRVLPDPDALDRARRGGWKSLGLVLAVLVPLSGVVWWAWPSIRSFMLDRLQSADSAGQQGPQRTSEPQVQSGLPSSGPPPRTNDGSAAAPPRPGTPPQAVPVVPAPDAATASHRPPMTAPYEILRDCAQCPELVKLPGGTFNMGSNDDPTERPIHAVSVSAFGLGRFAVTVGEWRQCVLAKACAFEPIGDEDTPVHNLSWNDAQQYVSWLSKLTNVVYRLPTEAEREYAARGNTTTRFWWGSQFAPGKANCRACGEPYDSERPLKVGSFAPNSFGFHDIAGGVLEWVSDCWHKNFVGAPKDGSSWDMPMCQERVLRGGSWKNDSSYSRAASRDRYDPSVRYLTHGMRVARTL